MNHDHEHPPEADNGGNGQSWLLSRTGAATVVAIAVLGFLVYTGHSAHLFGVLPYLLIFSCPLIHIFMHGGHHHGGGDAQKKDRQDNNKQDQHKHHGGGR
jgi:hypothetical protein